MLAPATVPEPAVAALRERWADIRALRERALFAAIATVDEDGLPHVTPVGSVFLHPHEPRGYYHPLMVKALRRNLRERRRFSLLFVDPAARTWLPALVKGRFDRLVAARLTGYADGAPRRATDAEVARWRKLVRPLRWTRGHDLMWSKVALTQELVFEGYRPVSFGPMPHPA